MIPPGYPSLAAQGREAQPEGPAAAKTQTAGNLGEGAGTPRRRSGARQKLVQPAAAAMLGRKRGPMLVKFDPNKSKSNAEWMVSRLKREYNNPNAGDNKRGVIINKEVLIK